MITRISPPAPPPFHDNTYTPFYLLSAGAIDLDGNTASEELLCLVDDDGNKEIFTSKSLVDINGQVFVEEIMECDDKGKLSFSVFHLRLEFF